MVRAIDDIHEIVNGQLVNICTDGGHTEAEAERPQDGGDVESGHDRDTGRQLESQTDKYDVM